MRPFRVRVNARTFLLSLIATVALTLGMSAVANAGTVTLSGNNVTFDGAGGEVNTVGYDFDNGSSGNCSTSSCIDITDYATPISAASGCNLTSSGFTQTAYCPVTLPTNVTVNLNDNNDASGGDCSTGFAVPAFCPGFGPIPPGSTITENGGDGHDTLAGEGAAVNNSSFATMNGGAGDDILAGDPGDTLNGDDGNDSLSTDLVGPRPVQNFGAPALPATVENGGNGDDSLSGSATPSPDQLNGGAGNDSFGVGAGPENVVGGDGLDNAAAGSCGGQSCQGTGGNVNVSLDNVANDGTPGQNANVHSDVEDLFGTGGADVLSGAPGPSNFIDGNGGNDTFNTASNPPDPDHVVCGDGFVTINGDIADTFSSTGSNACNGNIHAGPAAVGPTMAVNPSRIKLTKSHGAPLKVTCAAAVGVCRGAVEVDDRAGNVLGTASFIIPNARTKTVIVQLNTAVLQSKGFAKLLAKQAVSGAKKKKAKSKTLKAVVTVDATDNANRGVTTVSKNVTLVGKKKKKKH